MLKDHVQQKITSRIESGYRHQCRRRRCHGCGFHRKIWRENGKVVEKHNKIAESENGDIKVSARSTQELVEKGLDLSRALRKSAEKLKGVGGGHKIAAGATIPKGKEEEFLESLEKEIKNQLYS